MEGGKNMLKKSMFIAVTLVLGVIAGYGYTYYFGDEQVNADGHKTPLEGEPFADDTFADVSIPETEISWLPFTPETIRWDVTDTGNEDEWITAYYLGKEKQLVSLSIIKSTTANFSSDMIEQRVTTPLGNKLKYYVKDDETSVHWSKGDLHYTLDIFHHKDRDAKDNTLKPDLETVVKIVDSVKQK
jgi:hypothetical protein